MCKKKIPCGVNEIIVQEVFFLFRSSFFLLPGFGMFVIGIKFFSFRYFSASGTSQLPAEGNFTSALER